MVAIVPMKPLAQSKTRLRAHLNPSQRAALSLSMLSWVLEALRRSEISRTLVVGGDDHVRSISLSEGALWRPDEFMDLNHTLADAFASVWADGHSAAYVPADLPMLTAGDVNAAIDRSDGGEVLTICPAYDGGTNGLFAPPSSAFTPKLGLGSAERHRLHARELGLEMREMRSLGFERDLDTIDDLLICIERGAQSIVRLAGAVREPAE